MGSGEKGEGHIDFRASELGVHGACSLTAHLILGANGASVALSGDTGFDHVDFSSGEDTGEFANDRGNGHIDFRVTVHPDGRVDVCGEEFAVCDPAEGCHISLAWSAATGALAVQVVDADGARVAAQYHLAEAPSELRVEAAEIRWLSITPQ
jgi:hypothetical protein